MEQIKNDIVNYLKANSFMDNNSSLNDSDSLTQNGIIDSIGLLELMDYICEKYSIEIPEDMLTPENFDSLQGITNMITKLAK
ncbi:MAG TPA: acyl carrier protein [Methanosarcina sp.]|jgi:acyl carrier protein